MTASGALRALREALVLEHLESENEGDFATTVGAFDRPRYEVAATGEVFEGPDGLSAYYARFTWPDQRSRLVRLHHADEAVIVEVDVAGTHPDSGRPVRTRMSAFFVFDGASLVGKRVYGGHPTHAG
ncbi:nuclear transport factor 2 family protein [Saccharothrix coeruleofusca]|uniref:SnoaL-like domain-containing protein n=1 Tax=Saccharothrix coeruleofusca TaxID=33919 RepID=A0A918AJ97_9PSEU|nr:nuclear transport factor 2 family protein [Saccharothrix coeruleofusca]MBP2334037.1 hypothetical protein [Saccharothrix coeruleofusca]GGP43865.1 hypothetical protein GCM10010185_14450 [Saccharothrix coeruleofusca]